MKILVLGNGGREHALVWKLRQSARVSKIYCAPGNGGIGDEAECLPVDLKSLESMVALGERVRPDLTVVGPELPLTLGVVDEFTRRGWPVFGPTKAAAQLEASKSFAKEFLQRHRIPTAAYAICDSVEEVRVALTHFHHHGRVKVRQGHTHFLHRIADRISSGRNTMPLQKFFREALARLQLRRRLGGPKRRPAAPCKLIHHSQSQRQFRTNHRKVRPHLLTQSDHRIQALQVNGQQFRIIRDAAIAWRAIKLRNARRLLQLPHQSMLASPVAKNQNFHSQRESRLGAEKERCQTAPGTTP